MTTPGGGEPRTVDVPLGAPAPTVTYTLPPGVTFDVEAVYIEVDTTGAGADVTAELSISEQSGVVIARKAQTQTIDAGASGSATWALRLSDEAATPSPGGGIQFDTYPQAGNWLYVEGTNGVGSPDGETIELHDTSAGAFGIRIHSDAGQVDMDGAQAQVVALVSTLSLQANTDITATANQDVILSPGRYLVLNNLPIVNPGGAGRVWNNGGVLSIT